MNTTHENSPEKLRLVTSIGGFDVESIAETESNKNDETSAKVISLEHYSDFGRITLLGENLEPVDAPKITLSSRDEDERRAAKSRHPSNYKNRLKLVLQ